MDRARSGQEHLDLVPVVARDGEVEAGGEQEEIGGDGHENVERDQWEVAAHLAQRPGDPRAERGVVVRATQPLRPCNHSGPTRSQCHHGTPW